MLVQEKVPMDRREENRATTQFRSNASATTSRELPPVANKILERFLGIDKLREIYAGLLSGTDPCEFLRSALQGLNIRFDLSDSELKAIPAAGPVIVISNHPFGGIDGILLASVLTSVRNDVRILANFLLGNIPDLRPLFFLVDPFGRSGAASRNFRPLHQAVRWVREGHMLMAFPAGEVAHLKWTSRKIEDPKWNKTVSRLAHVSHADVLPVYFSGRNSALFQVAGLVHPRLRTAMLPRELLKKRGERIRLRVGQPIPYQHIRTIKSPEALTDYLRFRTYLLASAFDENRKLIPLPIRNRKSPHRKKDHPSPSRSKSLSEEIAALRDGQKLTESNEFEVFYARAEQIPKTIHEIGRLRETTFRDAGEGTGGSIDLDFFDNLYVHLFVWNARAGEVVGAYRLGATDEILPRHGRKGLYTYTLFKYRNKLLNIIGPALEMGRTFVRVEYQRSYSPLLLLWKGIGHYVVKFPRYRKLFGAVSISNAYRSYSRRLIAAFLMLNNYSPDLANWVRPRSPFYQRSLSKTAKTVAALRWETLDELSSGLSSIEKDGKGVPILIRQYLKLGGKVLAFNLDRRFSNTLDGLMIVDLDQTDRRILRRTMGPEGMEAFLAAPHPHAAAQPPLAQCK